MVKKFLEIRFERNMIESFIYNELRKEAPYLSGGEAQRLSRILANNLCGEWKEQIEEATKLKNSYGGI